MPKGLKSCKFEKIVKQDHEQDYKDVESADISRVKK